jgi:hypothetical protein
MQKANGTVKLGLKIDISPLIRLNNCEQGHQALACHRTASPTQVTSDWPCKSVSFFMASDHQTWLSYCLSIIGDPARISAIFDIDQ